MFDRIAARYDLLNKLISFGLDKRWRRKLVELLQHPVAAAPATAEILDVATGTADVALAVARAFPEARLTGLDPSAGMLEVGRQKVTAAGLDDRVTLVQGDAQQMPFDDDRFAAACISFGIRNVPDRARGLAEMARVVRPGGRVVILELGEPRGGIAAPFARLHVHAVVPMLGALLSGAEEYRYLRRSVAAFPPPEQFSAMMHDAGLRDVRVARMSFGAAHLFSGDV